MSYIRFAKNEDKEEILSLYHSLIGTTGCTWSKEYPTITEVEYDIKNSFLYCMCDENGTIIAVAMYEKMNLNKSQGYFLYFKKYPFFYPQPVL